MLFIYFTNTIKEESAVITTNSPSAFILYLGARGKGKNPTARANSCLVERYMKLSDKNKFFGFTKNSESSTQNLERGMYPVDYLGFFI